MTRNDEHPEHADNERPEAAIDVVLTEARTHRALLDDVERRGQGAGTEQQRELASLARHETGDLEIAAEHPLDGRDADDLFLGAFGARTHAAALLLLGQALLLDEHHRHRAAQVRPRGLEHLGGTARVELDEHRGLALAESRARVDELLSRGDDLPLEQHRPAGAHPVQPRSERRALQPLGLGGVVLVVDQVELESRGRAEHAQRLVRVLNAGQLHEYAVEPLPRHDGLGNAQLVDTVAQGRDVLLDCEVLPLADVVGAKLDREHRTLAGGAGGDGQGRILPADRRGGPLRIRGRAQLDGHGVDAVVANPGKRDALVAEQRAVVALHAREKLLDRARDVHLVEEVHTASQIEAQAHGLQPDGAHPARRARHMRQRHQVFLARGLLQHAACRELLLHRMEPQHQPVLGQVGRLDRDILRGERRRHRSEVGFRHRGAIVTRELQRRCVAVEVRQRKQCRDK